MSAGKGEKIVLVLGKGEEEVYKRGVREAIGEKGLGLAGA